VLHHLLQHQLTELGIPDSDTPPDAQAWRRLLEKISTTYDEADDRRFYQALFDQTNDAVFIIALSGKYLSVNRKAADMLGYTVAELVNMSMAQVVAPDEQQHSLNILELLIAGQSVPPYERTFLRKDGSKVIVEVNVDLVRDNNGTPNYLQSIVRDINERKQVEAALRASEEHYRVLVKNIPNLVVWMFDRDLRYVLAEGHLFQNQDIKQLYEGKTIHEALPKDRVQVFLSHYMAALDGHESLFEVERHNSIYQTHIVPVRDETGRITAGMHISENITARRKTEQALALERDLLQALMDNFPDLIYFKDANSRFIRVNKAQAMRLGCADPLDTLGKTDFDFFPPDIATDFYAEEQKIIATGQPLINRLEYDITQEGKPRWLSATKVAVFGVDGITPTIVGISRDITALKMAENTLRYQATLVNQISDAVYSTDLKETILTWNQAATRLYGWRPEEAVGQFAGTMVGSQMTLAQRQTAIRQIHETGHWEDEIIHTARDGRQIQVLVSTSLLTDSRGEPTGFIAISRDITERKQAQEAIRQNEEKLRQLYNATHWQAQELTLLNQVRTAMAQELDLSPLIRIIVKAVAEIFHYTYVSLYLLEDDKMVLYHQIGYDKPYPVIALQKGIIGRTARLGEPIFVENVAEDPDYVLAANAIVSEICVPLFDRDQLVGVFNIESTAEKNLTNNDMRLMIALSEQISIAVERARLYTSLRESKEQYQKVVESVREVIFQTDERGHWSFLNSAWTEMTGYSIGETLGQSVLDCIPPEDRALTSGQYRPLIKGEIPFSRYETRLITHGRGPRWVEVHARRTADIQGRMIGMSGTLTDITERKLNEQQAAELLAQSHTVEALRRFLTNVSHDLRTPLSVINTSLYLLRRKFDNPTSAMRHVDILEEQVTHLARIVEDLVEMTRLDDQIVEFEFIPVHLTNLVRDVLFSYESMAQSRGLTIEREVEGELPLIQADQMWLGRLVHNLVTNAVQYTPSGGTIWIKTALSGDGVMLTVRDNGIGIAAEDLPHIFDRFYRADSARPADKGGAGLGLAIVRKVVDAHGGGLNVESVPGEGSTFYVWLPQKR
jgi:PAS domain S-box-containing protein